MINTIYSLWIIPDSKTKQSISKIINKLSKKYNAIIIEPHMTLLGVINCNEKTIIKGVKKLARIINPFTLTLSEVSFSTTYFQSVFVRVKSIAKLMETNMEAKKIFKVDNDMFTPHISLLYGNYEMKVREQIAEQIKFPKLAFKAKEISIVPITENPSEWKALIKIPFGIK